MLIQTKRCFHCGETGTLEVPDSGVAAYRRGLHVQAAFPGLSADQREMLISGTHPACWTAMFGEEE